MNATAITQAAAAVQKAKVLTGTCAKCGREGLKLLANGTLPSHKASGQYGRCTGFLPAPGSVR